MEHRSVGDLSVSVVGLGCNQLGTAACDEATSMRVINEAIDAGITYFDVADEYGRNYADHNDATGWGRSEEILGRALHTRRNDAVIGTKFGIFVHPDSDQGGASARWARIAVDESLRRLGTDHIDLYQVHFPDPKVPIDETLGVLDELVTAGKVREIACCNFSAEGLREAAAVAADKGFRSFASTSHALNLIQRGPLDDVMPACEELGMAFIPYYPLASGVLTGKYRRGEPLPSGTRLTEQVGDEARQRILSERTFARLEALEAYAEGRGHTLLELAFAWLLGHPRVATVIAGAAKPGQAASNAGASGWRLTPDEVAEVTRTVRDVVA